MMRELWDSLFNCGKCKSEAREQTLALVNQVQELKAINHYQSFELEKKIEELEKQLNVIEEENRSLKGEMESRKKNYNRVSKPKPMVSEALDGNTVEIVDHSATSEGASND